MRQPINLNLEAIKSIEAGQRVYVRHLEQAFKVQSEFNSPTVVIETLKKAWELIHVS